LRSSHNCLYLRYVQFDGRGTFKNTGDLPNSILI